MPSVRVADAGTLHAFRRVLNRVAPELGGAWKWERPGSVRRRNTGATKLASKQHNGLNPPEAILNLPLYRIGKASRLHPNASTYAPWVQNWLTPDRLSTYLRAAGNNTQRAFDLYQWNSAVNAALLHDFAHTEVALRNALHRELSALVQPQLSWIAEPTTQVLFPVTPTTNSKTGVVYDSNEWIRGRLKESRRKFRCVEADTRLSDIKEGRIVADLTFGVWVEILAPRFEATLWTSGLRQAFAPGVSRADIYQRLRLLNEVRNRLAHHEPNLAKANAAHRELFWILRVVDRDVQAHVKSHSSVATLLASKP